MRFMVFYSVTSQTKRQEMRAHMAITAIHTREKTVGECGCLPVMMINGCYSVGLSSEQRQTLNFLLQLNHNWCFCFKNL